MEEKNININKKVFVSYLDDNGEKVDGYFDSVGTSNNWIIIDNGKNIIRIPSHRVLKVKEART